MNNSINTTTIARIVLWLCGSASASQWWQTLLQHNGAVLFLWWIYPGQTITLVHWSYWNCSRFLSMIVVQGCFHFWHTHHHLFIHLVCPLRSPWKYRSDIRECLLWEKIAILLVASNFELVGVFLLEKEVLELPQHRELLQTLVRGSIRWILEQKCYSAPLCILCRTLSSQSCRPSLAPQPTHMGCMDVPGQGH